MDYSKFQSTIDRSDMFYWQGDRPFDAKETKEIFLDRHETFHEFEVKEAITYGMMQAGKTADNANVVHVDPPIVSGSVNIVCKALLNDKTSVIVRMHPPKIKNGYFWAESLASKRAKEHGIPSYDTYFIDDTQSKFNFDYMIIECLSGKNIHKDLSPLSPALDEKIAEQTGMYAAKINSIPMDQYGFFDNTIAKQTKKLIGIHTAWQDHVFAAYKKNLDYLRQTETITGEMKQEIESIFDRKQQALVCLQPKLIQNDIADWNELAKEDGTVTGILDWDECFSGDPIMEIAAWSLFFDDARLEHFLSGYTKVLALPDDYEEKFHLYRLRYVVCKVAMRKKKSEYEYYATPMMQELLRYGLKVLEEELVWQRTH